MKTERYTEDVAQVAAGETRRSPGRRFRRRRPASLGSEGTRPLRARASRIITVKFERKAKYLVGSILASVVSSLTFVAMFGPGLLGAKGSSLVASATGAVAAYFLRRRWAWGRRGRANFRAEVVPYWTTVAVTAIAAAVVIDFVNAIVRDATADRFVRTTVNTMAFIGTYAATFVFKYRVFDRLFTRGQNDEGRDQQNSS